MSSEENGNLRSVEQLKFSASKESLGESQMGFRQDTDTSGEGVSLSAICSGTCAMGSPSPTQADTDGIRPVSLPPFTAGLSVFPCGCQGSRLLPSTLLGLACFVMTDTWFGSKAAAALDSGGMVLSPEGPCIAVRLLFCEAGVAFSSWSLVLCWYSEEALGLPPLPRLRTSLRCHEVLSAEPELLLVKPACERASEVQSDLGSMSVAPGPRPLHCPPPVGFGNTDWGSECPFAVLFKVLKDSRPLLFQSLKVDVPNFDFGLKVDKLFSGSFSFGKHAVGSDRRRNVFKVLVGDFCSVQVPSAGVPTLTHPGHGVWWLLQTDTGTEVAEEEEGSLAEWPRPAAAAHMPDWGVDSRTSLSLL